MPSFSFDESEFAENADPTEEAADAAVQELEASGESATDEDPELADVDLRLETADYYRAILSHDFFDTASPAAQVVDREIRTFIRERLEVLLGIRSHREVPAQFEEAEAEALKLLADPAVAKALAMVARGVLSKAGALKSEGPSVKKMPTPSAKASGKIAPKRRVEAKRPPPPVQKARVGPKSTPPAPAKKAEPARPATVVDRSVENPESQTFISHSGERVTLVEGQTVEEGGRRYVVTRNGAGTLYRRDVTGQVVAPGRLPPMSEQQMSIVSQQMAESQLSRLDETMGIAIVAALSQQ